MKKFVISILAVLYLSSSIGATIHLHYCMDKLTGWSLEHSKSNRCSKCGMSKKQKGRACCKDEYKQLRLQNDQKAAPGYQATQLSSVAFHTIFFELCFINFSAVAEKNLLSESPPRDEGIPLYLRNKVFRI